MLNFTWKETHYSKIKQKYITFMFRLLNKATIGIRHAIVYPCKLGAIDGRIGNFTQTTLHPLSWHILNPETAKRNDWNGTNETNETKLNKRNHRNDKNETNPTTILKRPKRPQRNGRNYQNNILLEGCNIFLLYFISEEVPFSVR